MLIEYLFKALASGLSLWESKDKTKYEDERLGLEKIYWAERNKPEYQGQEDEIKDPLKYRSSAVLGNIEFRLCILTTAFHSASARK